MTYKTKSLFLASYCAISIIDAESSCGLGRLPNILRLSNLEFTIVSPMVQIPTIGCVIYLYACMYVRVSNVISDEIIVMILASCWLKGDEN